MSNLSYCRFENTYFDLKDCYDNMDNPEDLTIESEKKYRKKIILLCQNIINHYLDYEDHI